MNTAGRQSSFPFDALNDEDITIIGACLNAILTGPVFKIDHAFRTLLAPSNVDIADIAARWPNCNDPMLFVLINNVLTNLVWYPHGLEGEKWAQYIPAPPERLEEILKKNEEKVMVMAIEKGDALSLAKQVAEKEGWIWNEPIEIKKTEKIWDIKTNTMSRGRNIRIQIDVQTGDILHKGYNPR